MKGIVLCVLVSFAVLGTGKPCLCLSTTLNFSGISSVLISAAKEGYRMVFASTCEHASTAFIFASTSSDQICDKYAE